MARTNRSGAATRARILDAAITVLAREGATGFTLRAVAAEAGVLYGNLTHHYATRDWLLEAMLDALVAGYRDEFMMRVAAAGNGETTVRDLVRWLLEDAVQPGTAAPFLQLWAMAAHMPEMAAGMARLYEGAIDAFVEAFGLDPNGAGIAGLRDALLALGTMIEGSSAIFYTRPHGAAAAQGCHALCADMIVPVIEARLAEARTAQGRAG